MSPSASFKPIFLAFLLFFETNAHAMRTAVFPEKIRSRAAIWLNQEQVFSSENQNNQNRPIWIHAGDSIATSWGNKDTLADALEKAQAEELPQAGSVPDLFFHLPDPDLTWYAGEKISGGGLFRFLETRSDQEWVLISTALAGAMLSQKKLNPLQLPLEVKNLDRVKLVSFSIGGNDLCSEVDPFSSRDTDPTRRLQELKNALPKDALVIAFKVPDVSRMYQSITQELGALPDSPGKKRLQNFCKQMWEELSCPPLKEGSEKISSLRKKILNSFENAGVKIIDLEPGMQRASVFELFSSDCFHPSRKIQKSIFDATAEMLDRELFGKPQP